MTVFFSMKKLLLLSSGNIEHILKLLENFEENKIKLNGDSFLLNLGKLLSARVSNKHKVEYLYLAAFRNYADYKLLGIDYLDISYIPDIDIEKVKRNPLITLENNKIIFNKEK